MPEEKIKDASNMAIYDIESEHCRAGFKVQFAFIGNSPMDNGFYGREVNLNICQEADWSDWELIPIEKFRYIDKLSMEKSNNGAASLHYAEFYLNTII